MICRASCRHWALTCTAALAIAVSVQLSTQAAEVPVEESPASGICSTFIPGVAAEPSDLEVMRAQTMAAAERGDPAALSKACGLLHNLASHQNSRAEVWEQWHAVVAAALTWSRRFDEAFRVAEWVYPRLVRQQPAAHRDAGYVASLLALLHGQRGDLGGALTWSQRGLEHQSQPEAGGDARTLRAARVNHASMLTQARRFKEAETQFAELLAESRTLTPPDYGFTLGVLRGISMMHHRQGDARQTLKFVREEIALRRSKLPDEHIQLGVALQNEAVQLISLAEYAAAQRSLEEAIAQQARGGLDLWGGQLAVLDTLAALQSDRGELQAALRTAQRAVDLVVAQGEKHSLGPRMAIALRRLASVQMAMGELAPAAASIRQAVDIYDALPQVTDTSIEWSVREALGRVQLQLGAPRAALDAATRARLRAGGKSLTAQERAGMLLIESGARQMLGLPEQAIADLVQADALLEAAKLPHEGPLRSAIAGDLCVLDGRGCREMLAKIDAGVAWVPASEMRVHIGISRHHVDQPSQRWVHTGKAAWAARASGRPALVWWSYTEHAEALLAAGRAADAAYFAKKAVTVLESVRHGIDIGMGATVESAFMADKGRSYRVAAQVLAQDGRIGESLAVLRAFRSSEFDDFIERGPARRQAPKTVELTSSEAELDAALERIIRQQLAEAAEVASLRRIADIGRSTPEERSRLADLEASLLRLREESQRQWLAAIDGAQGIAGKPGKGSLAEDSVLPTRPQTADTMHVYYVSGPRHITAITVSQSGQASHILPHSAAAVGGAITQLLDDLRARKPSLSAAQMLYRQLAQEVDADARRAGTKRMVVWLDGALRYLPFAYLHDGRQHLIERYQLTRAARPDDASAEGMPAAANPGFSTSARVVAFGVTKALAGMPALLSVGTELCQIVHGPIEGLEELPLGCQAGTPRQGTGPFKGRAAVNSEFHVRALRDAAIGASANALLHIGTHFVLRPGNAKDSWMLMGDGQRVTVDVLSRMPFGRPSLVTLSACETATPARHADGREIDGLASILLERGARAVLATLWQVEDEQTAEFMKLFYRALSRHEGDKLAALASAQRESMRREQGSSSWAAFVLFAFR